jgi:hypothetical protein
VEEFMRRYFATGKWVEEHLAQWLTSIMIMVNVGLGIAIFSGGIGRFSIPSYQPLIDYTHGNVWIWGVWICAAAILMATPFRSANILGLGLSMLWHSFWMACFAVAVIHYTKAAATPIPVYGGLCLFSAALMTARVIDKSKE